MPGRDLDLLIEAAREAGRIALSLWQTDLEVWDKGAEGPVSQADYAVDRFLRDRLGSARPDYGWLSEETPDAPERREGQRLFICDPIDGTRAFLKGEKSWAHSIAIVEDGRPVAGVVFLPARDALYAAEAGGGAVLNDAPLTVSGREGATGAEVLMTRAALDPALWRSGPPDVRPVFRPSLAYRIALVAEGRFDAMLTLRPSWEWDVAAGALIAAEAGARVTDRRGGALRFNNAEPKLDGLIVGTPGVHAGIAASLAS